MGSLTRSEAIARAEAVAVSSYHLELDLTSGPDTFRSVTTVRFTAQPGVDTFVEVRPQRLREARLNGLQVPSEAFVDGRLWLKGVAAENELVVDADLAYSNTGEGLHRFVDPADGEVYLSRSRPSTPGASGSSPASTSPTSRRRSRCAVTAPPRWTVRGQRRRALRSSRAVGVRADPAAGHLPGDRGRRAVPRAGTPSTTGSRWASTAGPVARRARWTGTPTSCSRSPPPASTATTSCSASGTRSASTTRRSRPSSTAGAMENPGWSLIRDELIFRSAVTDAERERRAVLIAHEMAHMWFGDLVTMRWWDDLWLNESFAEYLGWRVAAEATRFAGCVDDLRVVRKAWGYAADQRPSTPPGRAGPGRRHRAALVNFDGISYAKGASVLRQLVACVGDDAFLRRAADLLRRARVRQRHPRRPARRAVRAPAGRDLTGLGRGRGCAPPRSTPCARGRARPGRPVRAGAVVQTAPPSAPHRCARTGSGSALYDGHRRGGGDASSSSRSTSTRRATTAGPPWRRWPGRPPAAAAAQRRRPHLRQGHGWTPRQPPRCAGSLPRGGRPAGPGAAVGSAWDAVPRRRQPADWFVGSRRRRCRPRPRWRSSRTC